MNLELVSAFLPATWFSWFMRQDLRMTFSQSRQEGHLLKRSTRDGSQLGDTVSSLLRKGLRLASLSVFRTPSQSPFPSWLASPAGENTQLKEAFPPGG